MKPSIGNPARKDSYFKRSDVRASIIECLREGSNLLLSAPRRVGKTSILFDLIDNPEADFYMVYLNTESLESADDFFNEVMKALSNADNIENHGGLLKRAKEKLYDLGKTLSAINIGPVAIQLQPKEDAAPFEKLQTLLKEIDLEGKLIVLMLDEFPITLEHIQNKSGDEAVRHFLNQNRTLRQNPIFQEKIKFIYTGSIGLYTVVKRFNATDRINDLRLHQLGALSEAEAKSIANELFEVRTKKKLHEPTLAYLLQKIEWWIPFYFQLMIVELSDLVRYDGHAINNEAIDKAFVQVVRKSDIYLDHWRGRLAKIFKDSSLKCVVDILQTLKDRNELNKAEILNIAVKHEVTHEMESMIEILTHDGYIVEVADNFKFYSPILKHWWK